MKNRIAIEDLSTMRELDTDARRGITGRGVSSGYLFMSPSRGSSASPLVKQFFNFETFEVNNYEINNHIDKLINQTVNQNQMNLVNVLAGDAATISVDVNQDLLGSNSSVGA